MSEPKSSHLQAIVAALKKSNRKYLSLDDLSTMVGLYSDVLGAELTYIEPMIMMDPTLNMRNLLEPISNYLEAQKAKKQEEVQPKREVASSKELAEYPNIATFVYKKMTSAGGLVDPSAKLSDHDLHVLQKLVAREVGKRRKKRSKRKK
jgi:hypothetical protein